MAETARTALFPQCKRRILASEHANLAKRHPATALRRRVPSEIYGILCAGGSAETSHLTTFFKCTI